MCLDFLGYGDSSHRRNKNTWYKIPARYQKTVFNFAKKNGYSRIVANAPKGLDDDNTKNSLFWLSLISGSVTNADLPQTAVKWQLGFQRASSTSMESIIHFHDDMMFYLIFITIFVSFMLVRTVQIFHKDTAYLNVKMYRHYYARLTHHVGLEIVWTLIPTVLLCNIMSASFALLYSLEELHNPQMTVKVIGHQWYWSYEISQFFLESKETGLLLSDKSNDKKGVFYHVNFDSYMRQEEDLLIDELRLLEVDRCLFLPTHTQIRLNFTGADVIHS
jgi:cytochrome c oxidase subunit 2